MCRRSWFSLYQLDGKDLRIDRMERTRQAWAINVEARDKALRFRAAHRRDRVSRPSGDWRRFVSLVDFEELNVLLG